MTKSVQIPYEPLKLVSNSDLLFKNWEWLFDVAEIEQAQLLEWCHLFIATIQHLNNAKKKIVETAQKGSKPAREFQ